MSRKRVHINDVEWVYTVGDSYIVIQIPLELGKQFPNIKKLTVGIPVIKERFWSDLERGRWKKSSDGMVLPHEVKKYIEVKLLKKES